MKNKGLRPGRPYGLRYAAGFFLALCAAWFAACDNFGGSVEWVTYSIVYHANDGSDRMETFTHRYGTPHNIRENMFYEHDVPFLGWAGLGRVFDEGEPVQKLAARAGQIINLYAMWDGYIVTLNANGGFGNAQGPVLVCRSDNISLPDTGFYKAGYYFVGWSVIPNGTGDFVESPFVPPRDITLYAVWERILSFTAIFDANGGIGLGPGSIEIVGSYIRLPYRRGLEKYGHVFAGWSTTPDASTGIFMAGSGFRLTESITTLYAVWTTVAFFVVEFNLNGGSGTTPYTKAGGTDFPITLPCDAEFSRPGHYFVGWNAMADGTGLLLAAGQDFMPTENLTLYAMWE